MNLSAGKGRRKCPYGSMWQGSAAMITAAVMLFAQVQPGSAATPKPFPPDDLFGSGVPRLRGSVRAAKVPLPRPRPAEPHLQPATAHEAGELVDTARLTGTRFARQQAQPALAAGSSPSIDSCFQSGNWASISISLMNAGRSPSLTHARISAM